MDDFVENVERFQNGEPLILAEGCGGDVVTTRGVEKPPQATQETQIKPPSQSKNEALQARRNKQQAGKKSRVPAPANRKSPPPSKRATANTIQSTQPQQSTAASASGIQQKSDAKNTPPSTAKTAPSPPERIVPKSHPKKGKATKVCGCFGTRHKPLTNCLYCGRISCVVEGYDFCPFCGLMVEEITGG